MQKSYCYTPGVRVGVRVGVSVGVRMQNVRANVQVMEFQSLCIFSCILTLLIILIKPLTTKAHDRRASGDCGTSGLPIGLDYDIRRMFNFLCRLRSIVTHSDHFVCRLSVRPSVTLFCHTFQSYVLQVTHAFLGHYFFNTTNKTNNMDTRYGLALIFHMGYPCGKTFWLNQNNVY